ncbi:MAG: kinase [Candidatus Staskawiczbacteria bacterium]|nr:kinase [Candidatus Staskawiczbacteria bacterium]
MTISKTPFRISFFGGGTDYPAWYRENGGQVLSATIDKYCYLTVRHLPPFFPHKHRIVYSKVEAVNDINEIMHPVARAALEFFKINKGLEIHYDGDLPARAGMGSSSSFTVGLLHSLHALNETVPSREQLAKEAIYLERDVLKENVGVQDQVAVAHGGFNKIIFGRNDEIKVEPISVKEDRIKELDSHLLLYFTGFSRYASEIAKEQIERIPERKKELSLMHKMVDEAIDILKDDKRDIVEFGKLLSQSWQLKKGLTNKISNPAIDNIYQKALNAGAIGGKLLGAGGGGFILLFVSPEKQPQVREALKGFLEVPFRFEKGGSQIIYKNHEV